MIETLWLSGRETGGSGIGPPCPPVVELSAADEIEALPGGRYRPHALRLRCPARPGSRLQIIDPFNESALLYSIS